MLARRSWQRTFMHENLTTVRTHGHVLQAALLCLIVTQTVYSRNNIWHAATQSTLLAQHGRLSVHPHTVTCYEQNLDFFPREHFHERNKVLSFSFLQLFAMPIFHVRHKVSFLRADFRTVTTWIAPDVTHAVHTRHVNL